MVGKFIVFEGADGCGKTTQLRHFSTWLQAQNQPPTQFAPKILCTKEPGATALGQTLRQILLNPDAVTEPLENIAELLLYGADRAQHVQHWLKPRLAEGCWILCDRHQDSTVAYQGFGRGLDLGLIQQINQIATVGLRSDLTLWLDLPVELSLARLAQRGQADRMEQTDGAFHRRVREGFEWLAQQYPERIMRVDARGSEWEVAARIQAIARERLPDLVASTRPTTSSLPHNL